MMKQQILSLGKDSLIYGVGSVIIRFTGLLLLPLFTAYLSPEEFGVLAMLVMLSMIAQPLFSLGLGAAIGPSYFDGDNPDIKAKAIWTAFAIHCVTASSLVIVGWSLPVGLGRLVMLPSEHALLVSVSLTSCALTILATALTQRVQFEKQARLYVAITAITAVAAILVSVVTVVYLEWGVFGVMVGQLAGNVISFIAFLQIALKATRPSFSLATAKELLRLGLPLVPGFVFLFILMQANRYILEQHAGLVAVGIYSIGFNLGTAITIATSGIATAWYPFFMSYMEKQAEVRVIFGRIFTYYVFTIGFLCLLFFLAAKPVIILLTQEEFYDAAKVVGFVALAHFFQTAFNLFLPGTYYQKELKYILVVQGMAALFATAFNFLFIRHLGILGAAIGLAFGNLIMAALMYGWNKINSERYPRIDYEWGRIGAFALLFSGTVFMLMCIPTGTTYGEIFKAIGLTGIAACGLLNLLNTEEKKFIFSPFKGPQL